MAVCFSNNELVNYLKMKGIIQTHNVEVAMRKVDRGNYSNSPNVYNDTPQGIGYSVTISAPHMHARCLELIDRKLSKGCKVLDVGSGSGYLVACFAALFEQYGGGKCFGIEHIQELVDSSIENVKRDNPDYLDTYLNIQLGDGFKGLPSEAPFHGIHVGAAAPFIPPCLVEQLAIGGSLVIPVGPENGNQNLMLIEKIRDPNNHLGYRIHESTLDGVRYVPLTTREHQLRYK